MDEITIPGTFNVRDIGYACPSSPILPKKLLRSALLSRVENQGIDKLLELGVDAVIDLRSDEEIERDGADNLPSSIDHILLPIDTSENEGVTPDVAKVLEEAYKTDDPIEKQIFIMRAFYKKFVSLKRVRYIFGEALEVLANYNYPLFHCTAGKDRTGWLAALCHFIAGTDEKTIFSEYLLSNLTAKQLWQTIDVHSTGSFEEQRPALEVDISYIQSALDEVEKVYGNITDYIQDMSISDDTIELLRKRITVDE
ncbi:MAG: tyrosine-protein phosphatase [Bifidobacteriaceae bacterium]|nr:tyrosine-protein phosphatase [Bifidobacteriaceae bacterium]